MVASLACFVAWAAVGKAADDEGRFSVKGVGLAACTDFLSAAEERSPLYRQFGGYISGYLTALNRTEEATFDLAPFETTDTLAAYVAQACRRSPDVQFVSALNEVASALEDGRLESAARLVALPGQAGLKLYEPVADRVLDRLRALDHLGVAPADAASLNRALAAFQAAAGIDPTGVLDQTTLVLLLRQGDRVE